MVSQWLGMSPRGGTVAQVVEGNPLDRNVLTVLILLGLIALFNRREAVATILKNNTVLLVFFAYCALSILWSDYPDIAFKRWIKAIGDLVMLLVVVTDPGGSAGMKRLLARVGFVLIPLSILLIKYYPLIGTGNRIANGHKVFTGVTTDKNMLGVLCLIFGLAATWRILQRFRGNDRSGGRYSLIAQGVLLGMVFWLFSVAGSMTSLICFLFGTSLLLVTSIPALGRKRAVIHLIVVASLAVAAVPIFFDAGGALLTAVGRDPTLTGRTEIWSEVIDLAASPLFGVGFESFWLGPRLEALWSKHWWHPNEAHNGYIEIFLNLGWTGLLLLAILIIIGYRNVLRALREDPSSGLRLAYFLVGLTYGVSEAGFRPLHPVWFCFMLATTATPLIGVQQPAEVERPRPEPVRLGRWQTPALSGRFPQAGAARGWPRPEGVKTGTSSRWPR